MIYVLYAILVLIILLIIRRTTDLVTIYEYQRGIRFCKGRFVAILDPGQYRIFTPRTTIRIVDVRQTFATLSGQELITSDGVTLKLSLAARYAIADPRKAILETEEYFNALYLTLQMAVRDIVGGMTIDDILEKRGELGSLVFQSAAGQVEDFGISLLSADVKDIMLAGDVKKLFNQVVKARKEGIASLERARGETAALRNLANAAKMVQDNPALMHLRMLQQMSDSSGNTFVIGLPKDGVVVPAGGRPSVQPESEDLEGV